MKKLALAALLASTFASTAVFATSFGFIHSLKSPLSSSDNNKATRFNSIDSSGSMDIIIKPTPSHAHAYYTIQEPRNADTGVYGHIQNHTLYLRQAGDLSNQHAQVTIYMNQLDNLDATDSVNVDATNISSTNLTITSNTTGHINLDGMINLDSLYVTGPSHINIKWVHGNNVNITSKANSHINLAGDVGTLRVKLDKNSFLNAKYLRTKNTWISTKDRAQAEILASSSIQAYPQNSSNIYYYKTPQQINRINSDSGDTLQLGWNN